MYERMRWARLFVTIDEIAEDNKALVQVLSTYDPTVAVPLLGGLLTLPEYQSHCLRFEILVALAVAYCCGRKKANVNDAQRWFSQVGKSRCAASEDPAEDVFVSLVQDDLGNYVSSKVFGKRRASIPSAFLMSLRRCPTGGNLGRSRKAFARYSLSPIWCATRLNYNAISLAPISCTPRCRHVNFLGEMP